MILPFRKGFRENKTLAKISEFTVCVFVEGSGLTYGLAHTIWVIISYAQNALLNAHVVYQAVKEF